MARVLELVSQSGDSEVVVLTAESMLTSYKIKVDKWTVR